MKKIGVTGRLATGKSLVCSTFKQQGAYVDNADEIVHQILASEQKSIQRIITLLGKDIENNGRIDRSKVAEIVFSDRNKLSELEKILHPQVLTFLEKRFKDLQKQEKFLLYVVEVPLLFEAHFETFFDKTITVVADDNLCKKRYEEKGFTDYTKRVERLLPIEEVIKKSDYVIDNNHDKEKVKKQVLTIIKKL